MSDELVKHGGSAEPGPNGGYEHEDISPRTVLYSLLGLAVVCILVYFVVGGVYRVLDNYQNAHEPVQNPLKPPAAADTRDLSTPEVRSEVKATFPEPRLESDERSEIRDFRLREEDSLNSYGWVNQQAGTVRIPIERAMQLVAERGLPVRPQGEASPASKAMEKKP